MSLQGNATSAELRGKINSLDVLCVDAYAIAVKNGFEGTEEEWLASLKGEKGDKGDQGIQGVQGIRGEQGVQGEQGIQGEQGLQGEKGEKGDAGYTPVKGTDYYTEADKQALIAEIDTSLYEGQVATKTVLQRDNDITTNYPDNITWQLREFRRWGQVCVFTIQINVTTKITDNYGFALFNLPYASFQRVWCNNATKFYLSHGNNKICVNGTEVATGNHIISGMYLTTASI